MFEVEGEAGMVELKRAKKASMSVSSGRRYQLNSGGSEESDLGNASGNFLEGKSWNPSTYLSTSKFQQRWRSQVPRCNNCKEPEYQASKTVIGKTEQSSLTSPDYQASETAMATGTHFK